MDKRLNPAATNWVVGTLARLTLALAVLLGLAILAGGRTRFSGPTYVAALHFPGAPESWAVAALAIGLTGIVGSLAHKLTVVRWSLFWLAIWSAFFATSFIQAAMGNQAVGLSAPIAYGYLTILCIVLSVAHRAD